MASDLPAKTPEDTSRVYHGELNNSGNGYAAYHQAPGFEYAVGQSTGYHGMSPEMQHMEPFERLLSLHTPEHWMLDQIAWQATSPANSFTDQSSQSSHGLCCNPADLLVRTPSVPPPASHSTPEPEGPGIQRTASTRIRTARRPNITKGPPDMVPPERPAISLEGRTTAIGRTARKHKLYLSVSTCS